MQPTIQKRKKTNFICYDFECFSYVLVSSSPLLLYLHGINEHLQSCLIIIHGILSPSTCDDAETLKTISAVKITKRWVDECWTHVLTGQKSWFFVYLQGNCKVFLYMRRSRYYQIALYFFENPWLQLPLFWFGLLYGIWSFLA